MNRSLATGNIIMHVCVCACVFRVSIVARGVLAACPGSAADGLG